MRISKLFNIIVSFYKNKIKRYLELSRYNNFTIAEYFRKQGAQIGKNSYIVPRTLGTEPWLVKLGDHVNISEGVKFHTHDGGTWIFREQMPDLRVFGPIIIEDNCIIGEGAIIMPNVTIGKNTIVGVKSVVINDIPPNSIVMGVPARRFGAVDKYFEKCIERWKIQRPPGFHEDSYMMWETSKHKEEIREQLRRHLMEIFKDELS